MPIARVQLPDGRIAKFEVPDGTSQQDVLTQAESYFGRGVTRTPDFGPESMSQSMKKSAEAMGLGHSVVAGAGTTVNDWAMRMKQLLGFDLTPQEQADVRAGRQASGPVAAGRVAGDVAMSLPVAPGSLFGAAAAGAGLAGLTQPVLPGESTADNIVRGGIGGGAGYWALRALQGLVRPITPSANVQALADEGIIPTVGQSARATGTRLGEAVGRAEEAAASLPVTGDVIRGARRRAGVEELGRAALTRATPEGTPPTQQIGREGLDETYNAISARYNQALNAIGVVREDPAFRQDIARRVNQATVGMRQADAADARQMIQDIIGNRVSNLQTQGNAYPAQIAQSIDEDLGARIRDFRNASKDSGSRQMANALQAAQGAWRDLIRRNAPDQATRDMLDDARRAFANYVRVERTTGKSAAPGGEFNQTQLAQAVRETSGGGARKSGYARGTALMEDLSDPAKAVLSGTLGESGTVPRALLAGGLIGVGGGGGAYANEQAGGPGALTGLLAAAALSPLVYSRAGSRYAIGDLIPGQNVLGDLFGLAAPYGGMVGRSAAKDQ